MSRTFTALALLTVLGFGGAGMAWANGDLEFGYTPSPQVGEKPALYVTPARAVDELLVTCTVGGQDYEWTRSGLPAGKLQSF